MRMRTGRYYLKHTINHRVDAYYRQKQRDNYTRAIHNSSNNTNNNNIFNSNNANEDNSGCATALIMLVMIIAFIIIVNL